MKLPAPSIPRPVVIDAAVALFALISGLVVRHSQEKLAVARDEAQKAVATAALAQKQADASVRVADALRRTADSVAARAHQEAARADSAQHVADRLRGAYAAAVRQAPDTCRAVIASADSVIAAQDTTISMLQGALTSSEEARSDLQTALDTTRAAFVRLRDAQVPLLHATTELVKASHPSLLARLVPHFGLGSTAGLDTHGRPAVVTGLSLGWSVNF